MTQPTAALPDTRTQPLVQLDPDDDARPATRPTDAARDGASDTEPRSKLFDLSLTQLLGGSMAAATAAALGSRLGVVGTIAGAAVLSVVSAIAGTLYTNSMARAKDAVVLVRSRRDGTLERPVLALPARVHQGWSRPDRTTARRALATTGAVFALAAAFLAGLQLATGAPVTGTNLGGRTTAGVVVDGPVDSAGGAGSGKSDTQGSASTGATSSDSTTDTPSGTATDSGTDASSGATAPATGTPTTPAADAPPSVATTADPATSSPAATTPAAGAGSTDATPAPNADPAGSTAPAGTTPTP